MQREVVGNGWRVDVVDPLLCLEVGRNGKGRGYSHSRHWIVGDAGLLAGNGAWARVHELTSPYIPLLQSRAVATTTPAQIVALTYCSQPSNPVAGARQPSPAQTKVARPAAGTASDLEYGRPLKRSSASNPIVGRDVDDT